MYIYVATIAMLTIEAPLQLKKKLATLPMESYACHETKTLKKVILTCNTRRQTDTCMPYDRSWCLKHDCSFKLAIQTLGSNKRSVS